MRLLQLHNERIPKHLFGYLILLSHGCTWVRAYNIFRSCLSYIKHKPHSKRMKIRFEMRKALMLWLSWPLFRQNWIGVYVHTKWNNMLVYTSRWFGKTFGSKRNHHHQQQQRMNSISPHLLLLHFRIKFHYSFIHSFIYHLLFHLLYYMILYPNFNMKYIVHMIWFWDFFESLWLWQTDDVDENSTKLFDTFIHFRWMEQYIQNCKTLAILWKLC